MAERGIVVSTLPPWRAHFVWALHRHGLGKIQGLTDPLGSIAPGGGRA